MKQQGHQLPKGAKPYKVIIVGPQAVGKSSLLNRIIESKFQQNYTTTIGVDFKTIVVPVGLKQIILQIWDTAGQEKFRALTQSYFRSAQGCICVYDINDPESLKKAQSYLRDAFQYKISSECIFLLANKSDECENKQAQNPGKDLANKYEINFLRVSAKTGEGIGNFIGNLATKIDIVCGGKDKDADTSELHLRPTIRIDDPSERSRCAC